MSMKQMGQATWCAPLQQLIELSVPRTCGDEIVNGNVEIVRQTGRA